MNKKKLQLICEHNKVGETRPPPSYYSNRDVPPKRICMECGYYEQAYRGKYDLLQNKKVCNIIEWEFNYYKNKKY